MGPDAGPVPGPLAAGQSGDALVGEVHRVLARLPERATAVVAVSGGPDSTALCHLTCAARPDLDLHLVHVRHGLGDDADAMTAVGEHADDLGVPLHLEEVVVEQDGGGLEAAARRARYRALGQRAQALEASGVLVGHTADDQAETVLLRLARGTGVPGLGAMAPVAEGAAGPIACHLVRPLLRLRRADVRDWVEREGLTSVVDPMNQDRSLRRVRARREVLPALERLGPDAVGALARLADLARRDAAVLDEQARQAVERLARRAGPVVAVATRELRAMPPAVATRVVRRLVAEVTGDHHPPSAAHTSSVLGLQPGSAVDLPGARATAGGGWLAVGPPSLPAPEPGLLPETGELAWPWLGLVLRARRVADGEPGPDPEAGGGSPRAGTFTPFPGADPDLTRVMVGREALAGRQLRVRARRPGDRIATHAGTRKLKDVMIDAGVPRLLRGLVPIVSTRGPQGERVLWVSGLALDAQVSAARGTRRVCLSVAPAG